VPGKSPLRSRPPPPKKPGAGRTAGYAVLGILGFGLLCQLLVDEPPRGGDASTAGTEMLQRAASAAPTPTPTSTPAPAPRKAIDGIEFKVTCEDLVERQLKSPRSAKFPSAWEWADKSSPVAPRVNADGGVWDPYVDAQNSFGAELRTRFTCPYDAATHRIAVDFEEP